MCNVNHVGMIDHYSFDSQAAALQLQKQAIYRAAAASAASAASTSSGASSGLPPPSLANNRGALPLLSIPLRCASLCKRDEREMSS